MSPIHALHWAALLAPVAMFSRRPIVPQNRGRFTGAGSAASSSGSGTPANAWVNESAVAWTNESAATWTTS